MAGFVIASAAVGSLLLLVTAVPECQCACTGSVSIQCRPGAYRWGWVYETRAGLGGGGGGGGVDNTASELMNTWIIFYHFCSVPLSSLYCLVVMVSLHKYYIPMIICDILLCCAIMPQ